MKKRRFSGRRFPPLLLLPSLIPILSLSVLPSPPPTCLSYIAYDHPPPSPATPFHLHTYLISKNQTLIHCGDNCTSIISSICNGVHPPVSLAGRLGPESACLKSHMYIMTTSQPAPAYYNHDKSFEQFQQDERSRGCRLLHHYDGRGEACADDFDIMDRVRSIRERFDEVHDLVLGGGEVGDLVWGDVMVRDVVGHLGDVASLRAEEWLRDALKDVESGRRICL